MNSHPLPTTTLRRPLAALARAAWFAVFGLTLTLLGALVPLNTNLARWDWQVERAYPAVAAMASPQAFFVYTLVLRYLVLSLFLGTAVLIFWRRPDDRVALLVSLVLTVLPLAFNLGGHSETWDLYAPPWRWLLRGAREGLAFVGGGLGLIAVFFLFPDGRFSPPGLKRAALGMGGLVFVSACVLALGSLLTSQPAGSAETPQLGAWVYGLFWLSLLAALVLGAAGQVHRYRNASSPVQRQQTKWVIVGLAAFPLAHLLSLVLGPLAALAGVTPQFGLFDLHLQLFVLSLIPVTIGLSILCHRLWDIDVLLNRALVYGLLTALIVGVYVLGVGLASALLQTRGSAAASVLALVPVALLAVPLRALLQAGVSRLVPVTPHPAPAPFRAVEARPETTVLAGRRLPAVRGVALGVMGVGLALFVARIPVALQIAAAGDDWFVSQAAPAVSPLLSPRSLFFYVLALQLASSLVFLLVAGVLVWRRSRDWMALFSAVTLALVGTGFVGADGSAAAVLPAPWGPWLVPVEQLLGGVSVLLLLALFYLFPDGRFTPGWLRGAAALSLVPLVGLPFLGEYTGEWLYWPWITTFVVSLTLALAGQVYRYRRVSSPVQRQQTKWVILALAAQPAWMAFVLLGLRLDGTPYFAPLALLSLHFQILGPTFVPLAVGFSMLRYRLWAVDLVLNRALVYGSLTAAVIGLYILLVGALSALLQAAGSLLLSIVATGLIALLFQPLRQRLQRSVNRLMYGERDDPATVLSRLGQRLQAALEPEAVLPTIVETIAQALKLPYVAIALKPSDGGESRPVAHCGHPRPAQAWPLVYQTESIGQLLAAPRAAGEDFSAADRRLLEDIAHHASPAVHAVRLTTELQRSRERLVTGREEERRRLRRDLHDGLGSALAAVHLQSGAPGSLYRQDPAAGDTAVAELRAQLRGTVADIRRLVHDLRPAALDELGLAGAIRSLASKAEGLAVAEGQANWNRLQVQVTAPEALGSLPAAVEVAAYRIAQEALTNIVKHAHAQNCLIRVTAPAELILEIEDDGVGLPEPLAAGVGLRSMAERAAELGGAFLVERRPGGGTRVAVRLPLPAGV